MKLIRLYKQLLLFAASVLLVAVVGGQRNVQLTQADTPGVTIPDGSSSISSGGMQTPTTNASGSTFKTQPNTNPGTAGGSEIAQAADTSATVYSGDSLSLYASVPKAWNELLTSFTVGIRYQIGNSATTFATSATGVTNSNQVTDLPLAVSTWDGTGTRNDNISYQITAPAVVAPTWVYCQIFFNQSNNNNLSSEFFRLLVLPEDYAPESLVSDAVIFTGQTSTISVADLDDSIVPTYSQVTGSSVAPGAVSGQDFVVTANGTVGSTMVQTRLDLTGMPTFKGTGDPPPVYPLDMQTVYTGNLADHTINQGDNVTLTIDLPAGLTAEDVVWLVDGKPVGDENGPSLTLTNVQQNTTVQALPSVFADETPLASPATTNQAQVTVIPNVADFALSTLHTVLFTPSAADVDAELQTGWNTTTSTQVTASVPSGTALTWQVVTPGTTEPSPLATVDAQGLVTATGRGTGDIEVVATATGATGATKQARLTLPIITMPDITVPDGSAVSVAAPAELPTSNDPEDVGVTWRSRLSGATTSSPITQNPLVLTAVHHNSTNDPGDDGRLFQMRYSYSPPGATSSSQTVFYYSNVFKLNVLAPNALTLVAVPTFNFTTTVAALTEGFAGTTTPGGSDWLTAADTGTLTVADQQSATLQPWQLSVGMSTLTNGDTMIQDASLVLAIAGEASSEITPGTSTTLLANQLVDADSRQYSTQVQAYLKTAATPAAVPGSYAATLTWQLQNVPQP